MHYFPLLRATKFYSLLKKLNEIERISGLFLLHHFKLAVTAAHSDEDIKSPWTTLAPALIKNQSGLKNLKNLSSEQLEENLESMIEVTHLSAKIDDEATGMKQKNSTSLINYSTHFK